MISMWVLAILVVFTIGLGQRSSINLKLVRYQRDKLKSQALAQAGINRAILELNSVALNTYHGLDDAWSTGVSGGKKFLEKKQIGDNPAEVFTVNYYNKEKSEYFCMSDEERKININNISDPSAAKNRLKEIFSLAISNATEVEDLAKLLIKWRSATDPAASEEEKKIFKNNKDFMVPEELLLVLEYYYTSTLGKDRAREKAQEVFEKIKDYITVYNPDFKININTVSKEVLNIIAKSLADPTVELSCASGVVDEVIALRETNKHFTDPAAIVATTACGTLVDKLKNEVKLKSDNFRIESTGNAGDISSRITAVYRPSAKQVVYWRED